MGTTCVRCCHDNKVSILQVAYSCYHGNASRCVELGKLKCAQYWPDDGNVGVYGGVAVSCTKSDHKDHYVVRTLRVQYKVCEL